MPTTLSDFLTRERKPSLRFYLHDQHVDSFSDLVAAQPNSTFGSPTRSTLPLLDYWRVADERLREFAQIVQVTAHAEAELVFEHQVPVPLGFGKPSCTDLLIRLPSAAVAIEAKYTEPRYQSVKDWLASGDLCNRIDVLRGWIALLEEASHQQLTVRSISSLPYQLIHRTGSVCAANVKRRVMIYHVFSDSVHSYVKDVKMLSELLGADSKLELIVLSTVMTSTPEHRILKDLWRSKMPGVPDQLRAALSDRPMFHFGSTTIEFSSVVKTAA